MTGNSTILNSFDDKSEIIWNRNILIASVLFGLLFPAISWIIEFWAKNIEFGLSGIREIHAQNPILFLIDSAPFVLGLTVFFVLRNYQKEKKILLKTLSEKEESIQRNAHIAKMISEKDFKLKSDDFSKDDKLGRSLLLMRQNITQATKKETELNWIARGKDQISDILRQSTNIDVLAYETIKKLISYINAIQGAFYIYNEDTKKIRNISTYAYNRKKYLNQEYEIGQGLIGQAAYEMDIIYRREIPNEYVTITSGILGDKKPCSLLIVPLISDNKLQGLIEFASLENEMPELTIELVSELGTIIGQTIFNLKVNAQTKTLLGEAREMTSELRESQSKLRKNAVSMKLTQEELEKSNRELASKITEVENAQKRMYSLLENASEVISIYDHTGLAKYESPSVQHILGYAPEDLIEKNIFDSNKTISLALKGTFQELIDNPSESKTFEFQYDKPGGEILWLETTGRNLLSNQAIQGVIFNTRDITVRKIAEKAQRMSGQMQALSENSPDMIMRLRLDEIFFYVNPIVKIFTGIDTAEIIEKHIDEVGFEKEIKTFIKKTIKKIRKSQTKINTQINFPTKFGIRIMQVNAIPEFNQEKELETILFVAHDITEQKRIEQVIKDKNKAINDSINYAQRIQSAIIPDNNLIQNFLPKSFVLYKARDIVSGDFPWFFVKNKNIYIAAVDCTGHGVPGALLSFIGYFQLNNIVDHDTENTASEILDQLHAQVRKTLKQDKSDASARDGMDIAFCKINLESNEVQFAGAHRPLYHVRKNILTQYKGNPKAIGGIPHRKKMEEPFINHVIKAEPGDKVFFFSDGLADQIGGKSGRKYMTNRIREMIIKHSNFSMSEFSDFFEKDFYRWKGDYKQIDDVLLLGIEL